MKILMVNKFLYPNGGSETYLFETGKQLSKMGYDIQYFGMDHPKRIVSNNVQCYTSNMDFHTGKVQKLLYPFRILYSFEARKKIRRVLEDFRPDIVHLNNFNFQITPSILYEIRKFGKKNKTYIPIIVTAHDYQWICPNHMLQIPSTGELCTRCISGNYYNCIKHKCIHHSRVKSIIGAVEGFLYRSLKTYRLVDKIICPSKFMEEMLLSQKFLTGKTTVMHNFLVETQKVGAEIDKEEYILYFGRFTKEKGIETLIKVCKLLSDQTFYFAGSGPLQDQINDCPNAVNLGFLSGKELQNTIQKAKLVIFPSEWYENCPFTVMEAILNETPVIGTRLGGTPELIAEGENGELVEPGNADEMADVIMRLIGDRERLNKYRVNCKNKRFDTLEEYAAKLLELYHECAANHSKY